MGAKFSMLSLLLALLCIPYSIIVSASIYENGTFHVQILYLKAIPILTSLCVAVPLQQGDFPVIVFHHGYQLKHDYYKQIMIQVASHGYIVVAPQITNSAPGANYDIGRSARVINWLPDNLAKSFADVLAVNIRPTPDLKRLVIAGHSRGAKVAYGVALGLARSKVSALAALDPVDGMPLFGQTKPHIVLPYSNPQQHLNLSIPTLILGTKLGREGGIFSCAPEKWGHAAFYNCSAKPTYHFVATDFGHMDFLDDNNILNPCSSCTGSECREPFRRFTGGVLIAFLEAAISYNTTALDNLLDYPESAIIALETAESYGRIDYSYNVNLETCAVSERSNSCPSTNYERT